MIIIEDYLQELMQNKFLYIRQNPSALDDIIETTESNLASFKTFLATNTLNIRKGFPRTPAELPCICILLPQDNENEDTLGDYDEVVGIGEDIVSTIETQFENTHRIEIWTNNSDLNVHLSYLLKWVFLTGRQFLYEKVGMYRQRLSTSDLQPATGFSPEFVYRRGITLWSQSTVYISTEQPASEIGYISSVIVNQNIDYDGN